jgi:hypothetical protein
LHDEKLRIEYQTAPDREKYNFEEQFFMYLQELLRNLDAQIRRKIDKLKYRGDEIVLKMPLANKDELKEQVVAMEERIKSIQQKIEQCGEEGLVDEAQTLSEQVEKLSAQLGTLRQVRFWLFYQTAAHACRRSKRQVKGRWTCARFAAPC